jgi:hypothetical protein
MKTSVVMIVIVTLTFGTIACSTKAKSTIEAKSQCGALKSQAESEILCSQ